MPDQSTVDDAETGELYVLLGLTTLQQAGETPANSPAVKDACATLPDPDEALVGKLSEAEVSKLLYALESAALIEEYDPDERTATGKGRPEYELSVDPALVIDAAADRTALESAAAELRN